MYIYIHVHVCVHLHAAAWDIHVELLQSDACMDHGRAAQMAGDMQPCGSVSLCIRAGYVGLRITYLNACHSLTHALHTCHAYQVLFRVSWMVDKRTLLCVKYTPG